MKEQYKGALIGLAWGIAIIVLGVITIQAFESKPVVKSENTILLEDIYENMATKDDYDKHIEDIKKSLEVIDSITKNK